MTKAVEQTKVFFIAESKINVKSNVTKQHEFRDLIMLRYISRLKYKRDFLEKSAPRVPISHKIHRSRSISKLSLSLHMPLTLINFCSNVTIIITTSTSIKFFMCFHVVTEAQKVFI